MSQQTRSQASPLPKTSFTPTRSNLLQRKCGCGRSAGLTGKCSECQRKKLAPERGSTDSANESEALPIVHEVLRSPSPKIQPKLKIGAPNDKYEQEADRIADQVMRMPEPSVATNSSTLGGEKLSIQRLENSEDERDREEDLQLKPLVSAESIQRKELNEDEEKDEEEETLQTKQASSQVPEITPSIETGIQSLGRSSGQPLPPSLRTFMEPRFGHDFSGVRIHTGSDAAELSRKVGARAFTIGNNIVLDRGEFQPSSVRGRQLLAHELTHTVQQTGGQHRSQVENIQRLTGSSSTPTSTSSTSQGNCPTFPMPSPLQHGPAENLRASERKNGIEWRTPGMKASTSVAGPSKSNSTSQQNWRVGFLQNILQWKFVAEHDVIDPKNKPHTERQIGSTKSQLPIFDTVAGKEPWLKNSVSPLVGVGDPAQPVEASDAPGIDINQEWPYIQRLSTGSIAVFKKLDHELSAGTWLVALDQFPSPQNICYLQYFEWKTNISLERDKKRKYLRRKTGDTQFVVPPVSGKGQRNPVITPPYFNNEIVLKFSSGRSSPVLKDDKVFRRSLPLRQRIRLWWILRPGE